MVQEHLPQVKSIKTFSGSGSWKKKTLYTVEPRYNEEPRDSQKFVRYREVLLYRGLQYDLLLMGLRNIVRYTEDLVI